MTLTRRGRAARTVLVWLGAFALLAICSLN